MMLTLIRDMGGWSCAVEGKGWDVYRRFGENMKPVEDVTCLVTFFGLNQLYIYYNVISTMWYRICIFLSLYIVFTERKKKKNYGSRLQGLSVLGHKTGSDCFVQRTVDQSDSGFRVLVNCLSNRTVKHSYSLYIH